MDWKWFESGMKLTIAKIWLENGVEMKMKWKLADGIEMAFNDIEMEWKWFCD